MASIVEICNRALVALGVDPVFDIVNPELVNEKRCAALYPATKKREIRRHRWHCAKKEATLSPLATPSQDGRYFYPLPSDCLRPLRDDTTTWERRGKVLVSEGTDPLKIVYIADIPEVDFDIALEDVIVYKMAEKLAEPVTQNANKKAAAKQDWLDALSEAKRDNAFDMGDEDLHDSDNGFDWVTARF